MPETDRLAKLIAHRQHQEKKNDKLRIHKNKIEHDRLQTQVTYLDWNKELKARELNFMEGTYTRRLERVYARQLRIEEERIKTEEMLRKEKEARKRRLENSEIAEEMNEKDRRKQLHGIKQEWAKSFMTKARSLSGGYRDNDPPQVYYKRNGLVPPDRMVTPETSASAQASLGGGWRSPPSNDHLHRAPALTSETPYGIIIPDSPRHKRLLSNTKSRTNSARSECSTRLMTSSDDDDEMEGRLVSDVIRVDVRPSTAPSKRIPPQQTDGVLVTHQMKTLYGGSHDIDDEEVFHAGEKVPKPPRPATAGASVHFNGNLKDSGKKPRSGGQSARRRASLMTPNALMFRRKSMAKGSVSAPSSPRRANMRDAPQQTLMSNAEQETIRRKMVEKAECLQRERAKRVLITSMMARGDGIQRRLRSAPATRDIPTFGHYTRSKDSDLSRFRTQARKLSDHVEMNTMLGYVDRCHRGFTLADSDEAKKLLLETTQEKTERLKSDVDEFVATG